VDRTDHRRRQVELFEIDMAIGERGIAGHRAPDAITRR
jgi:hypothetical protein